MQVVEPLDDARMRRLHHDEDTGRDALGDAEVHDALARKDAALSLWRK